MLPPILDELSPETIGEDKIVLSLQPVNGAEQSPQAFKPVAIDVDYTACDPSGVVLPLEQIVQAPSASGFERHVFRTVKPPTLQFTPREGGLHLVVLREQFHNRWVGILRVEVAGDPIDPG